MEYKVWTSLLKGSVTPPASKSVFQRACAAALLTPGTTCISNAGNSQDDRAALALAVQLGACVVKKNGSQITLQGVPKPLPAGPLLHCGESGLSTRLFTPLAALSGVPLTITGSGSLLHRPLPDLTAALQIAGIKVKGGPTLPLQIEGTLNVQNLTLNGSASSQTATGFLFAMAASGIRPLTLEIIHPVSIPYLALTVEVLNHFGWSVLWNRAGKFRFLEKRAPVLGSVAFTVEGDWSSAAALIVAATFAGSIDLLGLRKNSLQADRIIVEVLQKAGAAICWEGSILRVKASPLQAFIFDATHAPDLVPVLAIAAASAVGESCISGMGRLVNKESNRGQTTAGLLRGFGIAHHFAGDSLFITGGMLKGGSTFDAQGDHRIAMAAAIGGLMGFGEKPTTLTGAEAVEKSYVHFFKDLVQLGAFISSSA